MELILPVSQLYYPPKKTGSVHLATSRIDPAPPLLLKTLSVSVSLIGITLQTTCMACRKTASRFTTTYRQRHESNAPNARRLVNNSILTPMWRRTFGLPHPRPDYPEFHRHQTSGPHLHGFHRRQR